MRDAKIRDQESILVVDDDLDFLDIIKRILQAKGYEAETVPSAGEAISRSEEYFYNVTILDISLPDTEGTELLSVLLGMHPDMIAIMLTGYSSVQNAILSLNRGAFAYLEKPLDPEHLLSVIGQGLEKQRLIFENRRLMEKLEQHDCETSILLEVSQAVSKSLDPQEIIDSALGRVAVSMGTDASFVHLFEDGCLVLKGCRGFAPDTEVKDGIIGRIFERTKPIVISRITTESEPSLASLVKAGYQSFAGAPLTIVGESIGVIGVATYSEHLFTDREVGLLAAMGREISIAVRNAQLYEEASSARALRELDTLRTEFLANVSHELRTPLAVIKGSASSLLQPDVSFDEPDRRDFLQSIDNNADRLTRLVEDLLTMSRLESGALEVRKERRSLAEVVESVRDRLDNLAAKHALQIDIPPSLPPVLIDDDRIGEVLINLVENAAKYSPEGTRIVLQASPNNKDVIVSVTDEGNGIPREFHQKIFDRFYQVNNSEKGHKRGTGLGLSICRGIVETHGGRIWMESESGEGAKFSFSISTN